MNPGEPMPKAKNPTSSNDFDANSSSARPNNILQEIQEARQSLRNHSLREYHSILSGIAKYFLEILPSQVDHKVIFQADALFAQIEVQTRQQEINPGLSKLIQEIAIKVGALSDWIQNNPGKTYDQKFFRALHECGEIIKKLAALIHSTKP
jgi:hypothetical protein